MCFLGWLPMRLTIAVAVALGCLSCGAAAKDMSFALQEQGLQPRFDLHQWIFADGDIVPGTANRFLDFMNAHPQLVSSATVILNSPGGSPLEGIRLGDAIRSMHFRTDVGSAGSAPMQRLPGQCMSACIFPYLGGEYRYLADGSSIGIHQFRFDHDLGAQIATEVSQQLSGEIVAYIKRSRADPDLFTLMTHTPPEDIHLISADELNRLKVVTGDIYSEEWSFEVHSYGSYLKADQITWRGENKILFGCNSNRLFMMVLSELPDREATIREAKNIVISINGQWVPVPASDIVGSPSPSGRSYIAWTIAPSPEMVGALKVADSIGSGLSPAQGIFAGIRGIRVGDAREKLVRTLTECLPSRADPKVAASAPSNPSTAPDVPNSEEETVLAKRVARNFSQRYKKAGMAGLKESIEACYGQVRKTLKESSLEYCYLLDQLACAIDEATSQQFKMPQASYWQCASALGRTVSVMALMQSDPQARLWSLQRWAAAKSMSLSELAALP